MKNFTARKLYYTCANIRYFVRYGYWTLENEKRGIASLLGFEVFRCKKLTEYGYWTTGGNA